MDNLLGWARVNIEIGSLMRFPEVLACRNIYSNVRNMTGEVKKLAVALYSFGAGSEPRFVCPTCSASFPSQESEYARLGSHLMDHFDIPPNIIELCLKVLKLDITYVRERPAAYRDSNTSGALVIKDEPVPTVTPSNSGEAPPAVIPAVPSGEEDLASPASALPVIPSDDEDNTPLLACQADGRDIPLLVSQPVLERVVQMLPNGSDVNAFRACMSRYTEQHVFERNRRFICASCGFLGPNGGFSTFSELRRHVIRKHCNIPESLMVFCLLLVRQQMMGCYELLPDDLQLRLLELPSAQQTQINYRITQFVKQREDVDKKTASLEDIVRHVECLCENGPGKRKGVPGRLIPSTAVEADTQSSREKVDTEAEPPTDLEEKKEKLEKEGKEEKEITEDIEAVLKFDEAKFDSLTSAYKIDPASKASMRRKMISLDSVKILCHRIRADRIKYSCVCGKYEEIVQSFKVTDGPRRHGLRAHVRISKVHWSLCLQCAYLEFPESFNNLNTTSTSSTKRPASPPTAPSIVDQKRSRVEGEESDSPALMVCGFKMRVVDKRKSLAHVTEMDATEEKGYSGFTISGVPWHPLTEAKQQLKTDPNASELRQRLTMLPEYRVYTLQGSGNARSYICSACGFASDYTSRDVKRHLLVLHLGINVELVTSILNFAETRSFVMEKHSCTAKDLVSAERWAGCAESDEPPDAEAGTETDATAASTPLAVRTKGPKGRKRLVPRLPAIARKTQKPQSSNAPPNTPVTAVSSTASVEESPAKGLRMQPYVLLVRLSPKEIAKGRVERSLSPTLAPSPSEPPSSVQQQELRVVRVRGEDGTTTYRCSVCPEEKTHKVDMIAHLGRVHASLNQSWRYACKACGAKFTGMTMYKTHVDANHLGTPVLLNRIINKDWQTDFPVVDLEDNW